jgi:hypothetical protein
VLSAFLSSQKLCLVGGMLLFARMALAYAPGWSTLDFSGDAKASAIKPMVGNALASTEWLRGEKLCTWKGNYHLAWSVPMADPTYNVMGAGIHSFLMFAVRSTLHTSVFCIFAPLDDLLLRSLDLIFFFLSPFVPTASHLPLLPSPMKSSSRSWRLLTASTKDLSSCLSRPSFSGLRAPALRPWSAPTSWSRPRSGALSRSRRSLS